MSNIAKSLMLISLVLPFGLVSAQQLSSKSIKLDCLKKDFNYINIQESLEANPNSLNLNIPDYNLSECSGPIISQTIKVNPSLILNNQIQSFHQNPNSNFSAWNTGNRFDYSPPTLGDITTYEGTGGKSKESAKCWTSKVWGLYGNGNILKKSSSGMNYLRWHALSVEPSKNNCKGDRIVCDDDPDATGYHHIVDGKIDRLMRNSTPWTVRAGTAGHDLSQLLKVDKFYSGWVTIRIRGRLVAGNEKFYLRIFQGFGKNNQMNFAHSQTLPGIQFDKSDSTFDYISIVNLNTQFKYISDLEKNNPTKELIKYMQISLVSARPELGHVLDVFSIKFFEGIHASPDSSESETIARINYCK